MILVCDNETNARTKALRKMLFEAGFPCAEVAVSEIGEYLPAKLIICYYEAFDNIRRGPYDNIFAVVIGKGFVNSALNAVRVDSEKEACEKAKEYLCKIFGIGDDETFPLGVAAESAVYLSKDYFEIYGNYVDPTESEYMIFKYLLAFADQNVYLSPLKIRKFCYRRELSSSENIEGNISVHIHNLNHRLELAYGKPIIRSKRYLGYYSIGSD